MGSVMKRGTVRVMLLGVARVFRPGLRSILECEGDVTVVAEGDTVQDMRTKLVGEGVDVCVVDADQEDSAELLDTVLKTSYTRTMSVIVLTGRLGLLGLSDALGRGVSAVVLTDQAPDVLREAIIRVHGGEGWLNRNGTASVLNRLRPARRTARAVNGVPREAVLTKRERKIVALVGRGWRNSKIAQSLYISDLTLRNHLTSIFRKLSLSSREAPAAHAFRHGVAVFPARAGRPLKTSSAGSERLETGNRAARG